MDVETGSVLFEKNADEPMPPASMSKLMTLAVLFSHLKDGRLTLNDTFHVSEEAWRMGGSKMFVRVDTDIRIEDLIRGIIVQSGNDACVVVAEGISGTEEAFAREMTKYAREIGLTESHFANAHGFPDPGQVMTARELALLALHLIKTYPQYYHYFSETDFTWSDIHQPNRNPLLYADIGADGLKTGHTEESGYGLVGSAVEDGRRLILVVNGLKSEKQRSTEAQRLLRVGFRDFKSYPLFAAGDVVGTAQVWQGVRSDVALEVREPVTIVLRPQDRKKMVVSINYVGPLPAPVTAGTQVAELKVTAPNSPPLVRPLYAAETVEPMGLFGRMGAAVIHLVRSGLGGG
jgi:D-alanyl-D-alanine carboxypeptidase (penicillin-binding protein 5/6)